MMRSKQTGPALAEKLGNAPALLGNAMPKIETAKYLIYRYLANFCR